MASPTSRPFDPTRCPLCGEDNTCGSERGAATCWCYTTTIPEDVLERVPADLRNRACLCQRCASGQRGPDEAQALMRTRRQTA